MIPLETFFNKIASFSERLQSISFVKTRLDKSSTVVVKVASFVGKPVVPMLFELPSSMKTY